MSGILTLTMQGQSKEDDRTPNQQHTTVSNTGILSFFSSTLLMLLPSSSTLLINLLPHRERLDEVPSLPVSYLVLITHSYDDI